MSDRNEFVFVTDMEDDEFVEETHIDIIEELYDDVEYIVDFDFGTRTNRGVEEFVQTVYYTVPEDMSDTEVREVIGDTYREIIHS